MLKSERVQLRQVRDDDMQLFENWAEDPETLWGPYQRIQLDSIQDIKTAYQKSGLLSRESGLLMIEIADSSEPIGIVRYTLSHLADPEFSVPEIGFVIADKSARGKGYAKEAVSLLIDYLFKRYPTERISAFTDIENIPSQKLMESLGFQREGIIRRAMFRDGDWSDILIYGLLRDELEG